jgi:arginine exporter protein ArgO
MEIEMAKRARRMGAFSAILVMIAICYFAYNLIIANYMLEGLVFAGIGFAFLLISGCKYNKSNMRHCSSNNKISTTEEQSQETQVKKYHQKRRFYKNKR